MMLSSSGLEAACIIVLNVVIVTRCTEAAFFNPREQTAAHTYGSSTTPTIEPFISPTSATASSASSIIEATGKSTGTSTPATSSSTASSNLGGPFESTDNATTSSNADHGSCHRTYDECHNSTAGPFCEPKNNQEVWVGRTYSGKAYQVGTLLTFEEADDIHVAIWSPDCYGKNANVTINLSIIDADSPDGASSDPVWNKTVSNFIGEVELTMDPRWLQGQSRNNLSFSIFALDSDDTYPFTANGGPTISLINAPTLEPGTGTKHSDSHNKLGVEVGVPLAIVFIAAICIGLFLFMRRRRRGYLGAGRSRSQRMKGHGDAKLTGDDLRIVTSRRRQDSFKDEPMQGGVELTPQPRMGHKREDSMGGNLISPVSPVSFGNRRTSNAFRDEIERQRNSGR